MAYCTCPLILTSLLILAGQSGAQASADVRTIVREALEAANAAGRIPHFQVGIPTALARAGDVEGALAAAKAMKQHAANELERIAVIRAQAGDLHGAFQTADLIVDGYGKARALAQVAGVQADQGKANDAQETVAKITDPGAKAWALALIASAQSKAGQLAAAIKTAKAISDDANLANLKAGPLSDIALAQAKTNDIDEALRTTALVEPDYYRADLLAQIADQRANARDVAGAKRFLKQAEETLGTGARTEVRGFALEKIATVQMKLGDRETARKTFREALDATGIMNKRLIVAAQAKAGDEQEALQAARRLGLVQGVEYIAVVQAESGDLKGALATAESINDLEVRSTALAEVAAAQRAAGKVQDAKATYQKAIETAHSIVRRGVDDPIARAVYSVAYYQAKSGDAHSALDWARKEQSNYARARALLGTAVGILDRKEGQQYLGD